MDTKPYGDVTYADPGYQDDKVKRYPLDTEQHVRAAWSYINQAGNASKYTAEQLAAIKGRIQAAAKRFGVALSETNSAGLDWLSSRAFSEQAHPRAPKGNTAGGEFAPAKHSNKGHGGGKAHTGHGHGAKAGHAQPQGSGTLSYDPKSNTGTGYNLQGGDARVRTLQDALNRLGVTDDKGHRLAADGKLGPLTTQAVMAAQRRLGLKQDGHVTPALLKALADAKSLPARRADVSQMCIRAFDFESRSSGGDGRTLEGYAAVFNTPARIADRSGDFDEVILPGAFARSLERRKPVLQFEHGRDPRVGAVPIGAFEDIREDAQGLYVRARLFDNPVVEPVRQAIQGQAISGMSFRFSVPDGGDRWTNRAGNVQLREIRDTDTAECGPVVFPAYDATSVSVRSLLAQLHPDEYRTLLRELAAELRLAVDFEDFTGRPDTWSAGGGDRGPGQEAGGSIPTSSLRTRDRVLRMRGIL